MANLQQFGWRKEGFIYTIFGQVITKEEDGNLEFTNFLGENEVQWPQAWDQLTDAQREKLINELAPRILAMLAGVE